MKGKDINLNKLLFKFYIDQLVIRNYLIILN